ncbi:SCO4848 family membrane protein [Streptomyces sp. IBSBF 2435]|uniref:SCO4848 family membrane protein n=1 Tax=Streptomyces sp. IBSBF 2435 TaxID=2903531 RepID=UPI002FDC3137
MKLTRPVSWFLAAFGVWSWIVWVTFVKNLWKDTSGLAFHDGDHSSPTAYFWIHLTLAVVSTVFGTVIGAIGVRGLRALRRDQPPAVTEPQRQDRAPARK